MARFVVHAVSAESVNSDSVGDLLIYVSVSRADNGKPVTGLTKDNFRSTGSGLTLSIVTSLESKWGPAGTELAGCYELSVRNMDASAWIKGEYYSLGVQVRTFNRKKVVGCGQTVVNVQSLGT